MSWFDFQNTNNTNLCLLIKKHYFLVRVGLIKKMYCVFKIKVLQGLRVTLFFSPLKKNFILADFVYFDIYSYLLCSTKSNTQINS